MERKDLYLGGTAFKYRFKPILRYNVSGNITTNGFAVRDWNTELVTVFHSPFSAYSAGKNGRI